jgi:starch synthase
LKEAGLDDDGYPVFASISRLDVQKGIDLVCEVIDESVALGMRYVLLGTGDPVFHEILKGAQKRHPGKVRVFLEFDGDLAHRIEAGADAFLMPSRYEPCGLNQMMSLAYGTVPIVRRTGGLADTVVDFDPKAVAKGESTGFVFSRSDPADLLGAVARALRTYSNPENWRRLVQNGMAQDWSWSRSAQEYLELYLEML